MPIHKTPISLDRNENHYGPAPACFEILRRADASSVSSYSKAFARGVKSDLSERLAAYFGLPESSVLLGYGAEDLLKQSIQCYLRSGDKLLIPSYSWWYYRSIAGEADGNTVEYPLTPGVDRFSYDVSGMLEVYRRERPKVVLISSPNNPTGNSLAFEDLTWLLQSMADATVILDEAYVLDGSPEHTRATVEAFPNVLVVRSFSKFYALAGLRIGYALAGKGFEQLARSANRYLGFNRLSEEIALAALASREYYAEIARKMTEDKERYYRFFDALDGFTVYRSDANFVLAAIPSEIMTPLNNYLKERGLLIKFMNEERLRSHVRITLGTTEENAMIVDAIREFLRTRR